MKCFLFLLLLCVSTTAVAQTVQSDCTPPSDSIRQKYLDGAYKLALKEILQRNDAYKDSVHIPGFWRDTILNPMMAVYNATGLPARDTVVLGLGLYVPIFRVNYLSLNRFRLFADSTQQWGKNLRDGVFPSGFGLLDTMITQYNLVTGSGTIYNGKRGFEITQMVSFYNFRPLIVALNSHLEVDTAYTYRPYAEAAPMNDINDSLLPDRTRLTYTYNFGDCPVGCQFHRSWVFDVFPDCSVTFVGSYGDNLINPGAVEDLSLTGTIRIAPNPFQNTLSITAQNKATLRITDVLGRVWAVQELASGSIEINTAAWPSGIYFCAFTERAGQEGFIKVIKE